MELTPHLKTHTCSLVTFVFPDCDLLTQCVLDVQHQLITRPPIVVFGKKTQQPRDVAFFSDIVPKYEYSRESMPAQSLTTSLIMLLNSVNTMCNTSFNAILVNRYNDGDAYICAHSDNEKAICNQNVVSVSYGATRTFRIRDKSTKKRVLDVPLRSGEVCWMDGDFQQQYTHEIPTQRKIKDCRYSFTFRQHIIS